MSLGECHYSTLSERSGLSWLDISAAAFLSFKPNLFFQLRTDSPGYHSTLCTVHLSHQTNTKTEMLQLIVSLKQGFL